ncbi:hypothetical protein MASR1M32_23490 [Rhodobacter sp.]
MALMRRWRVPPGPVVRKKASTGIDILASSGAATGPIKALACAECQPQSLAAPADASGGDIYAKMKGIGFILAQISSGVWG